MTPDDFRLDAVSNARGKQVRTKECKGKCPLLGFWRGIMCTEGDLRQSPNRRVPLVGRRLLISQGES